ncbi:hypothetical protein [Frankia gtarii]|uniref:hypothetical protein n=1 Tax=Frankia gtarii TaxID=2950102 RepID=UPI0021C01DAA|nr:hypothetical protein [Frankia gtarii]
MTARMIPLSELEPTDRGMAAAAHVFASVDDIRKVQRLTGMATLHAETLADAIEHGDAGQAAAAVRALVAHVRAGRARWAELDSARREAAR